MTQDLLRECNDQSIPLEDFSRQFCARCLQPECTRSQHGTSAFEKRVTTWKDRLFDNIPRMPQEDPRYDRIHSKKFLVVDTSATPELQGWVDPRDLADEVKTTTTEPVAEVQDPTPTPVAATAKPMNTAFARRMVGAPTKVQAPRPDSWELKKESASDKVVSPGARIRFGV